MLYCKHLFLVGIFIWRYKQKLPKYDTAKNSFEFSYTINIQWTNILSMLVSVSKNQLFNGRVCFHAEKATSLKELLLKLSICSPLGIFFPLRVLQMRIENNFKGY